MNKPPMPEQPKTKELPAVKVPESQLDAILTEVRAMRGENSDRFDRLETTVETLVEDGKTSNMRMTRIEVRMDSYEERGTKYSGGIRQLSDTDSKHDAAIGHLAAKVDDLAAKTDAQTVMLTK